VQQYPLLTWPPAAAAVDLTWHCGELSTVCRETLVEACLKRACQVGANRVVHMHSACKANAFIASIPSYICCGNCTLHSIILKAHLAGGDGGGSNPDTFSRFSGTYS
jgi:hypothetical protein